MNRIQREEGIRDMIMAFIEFNAYRNTVEGSYSD